MTARFPQSFEIMGAKGRHTRKGKGDTMEIRQEHVAEDGTVTDSKDEANELRIEELLNLLVQRDKHVADLKLENEELKSDLIQRNEQLIEKNKNILEDYNYTNDLLAENGRLRDKMLEARRSLSY
jgi:hypothetical protein